MGKFPLEFSNFPHESPIFLFGAPVKKKTLGAFGFGKPFSKRKCCWYFVRNVSRPVILFIGRSAKVGRCVFFLVSHGDVVTIVSQNQRGALQLHLCAKSMIFYRCQMSLVSHQSLEICKGQRKCLERTQLSVSRKSNQINRLTLTLQASNRQTKKAKLYH